MSQRLQQEIHELEQRCVRLEAKVDQIHAAFEALKADVKAPEFPPLVDIPPVPRFMVQLGYVNDPKLKELDEVTADMRPESDDG